MHDYNSSKMSLSQVPFMKQILKLSFSPSESATNQLNLKKWALQARFHGTLVAALRIGHNCCDVQAQDRRVKEEMKGGERTRKKKIL